MNSVIKSIEKIFEEEGVKFELYIIVIIIVKVSNFNILFEVRSYFLNEGVESIKKNVIIFRLCFFLWVV